MENQNQVELWQEEGYEALRNGDLEHAMEMAENLKQACYSSCFELAALVQLQQEELEAAIETLREGVGLAPDVWLLWQLLGNCLSDADDFEGALEAYDQAFRLEGSNASVLFNRALVLSRMGDDAAAIEAMEAALNSNFDDYAYELRWRIRSTLCLFYADNGQSQKAYELIPRLPEEFHSLEDVNGDEMAQSFADIARVLVKCERAEYAKQWLYFALQYSRQNEAALHVWREIHSREKEASTYYHVLVRVELDEDEKDERPLIGFITGIWVVANNADEAGELAVEFESQFWQNLPVVEEVEEPEECDLQPIGVFEVQGRGFYSSEEEES